MLDERTTQNKYPPEVMGSVWLCMHQDWFEILTEFLCFCDKDITFYFEILLGNPKEQ